jgi:hypothetical protein
MTFVVTLICRKNHLYGTISAFGDTADWSLSQHYGYPASTFFVFSPGLGLKVSDVDACTAWFRAVSQSMSCTWFMIRLWHLRNLHDWLSGYGHWHDRADEPATEGRRVARQEGFLCDSTMLGERYTSRCCDFDLKALCISFPNLMSTLFLSVFCHVSIILHVKISL